MKRFVITLILAASTFAQAGRSTADIHNPDSYLDFAECKAALENTLLALAGFEDTTLAEALQLKAAITFSPLVEVGSRPGPATASEGAQISLLRGKVSLPRIYDGTFVLEAGHGNCEVRKLSIQEAR